MQYKLDIQISLLDDLDHLGQPGLGEVVLVFAVLDIHSDIDRSVVAGKSVLLRPDKIVFVVFQDTQEVVSGVEIVVELRTGRSITS